MPWQNGSYVRDNGRNTGPIVWDQDAVATQDMDSVGHDTHDQDLADGITATLNIQGQNAMLADLKVNGFKITGIANGTAAGDGVNKGQLDVVDNKIGTNTTDIAQLRTDVGIVDEPADGNLQTQIFNNVAVIGQNSFDIGQNTSQLSNHEGRITTNEVNIQSNTDAINALGGGLEWDESLATGEYQGITTLCTVNAASPSIPGGTAVRWYNGGGASGSNDIEIATSDTEENSRVVGVTVGTGTTSPGATVRVLMFGYYRNTARTGSGKGTPLYLLDTAGSSPNYNMTPTKPLTGQVVQVAMAMTGGEMLVNPSAGNSA